MSKTLSIVLTAGLLGVLLSPCPVRALPAWMRGGTSPVYTETVPDRGFHLFTRPAMKDSTAQWDHVQALQRAGRTRAAAKQALALRLYWPYSAEAPQAQLAEARLLEERGHLLDAFDSYQYLIDHYAGRFEFNEVLAAQRRIARKVMSAKKGKFLFLPGFTAPERAIPLLEKIVASAPEDPATGEDYYLIGQANEATYEYGKAIEAYFRAMNRFPSTEAAEKAAFAQAICHVKISDDEPNDKRALDTAKAACQLFLQRHPRSASREEIEEQIQRLTGRQADNAFELARYYDTILRKPAAALIAYRDFADTFPADARASRALVRIQQLTPPSPETAL